MEQLKQKTTTKDKKSTGTAKQQLMHILRALYYMLHNSLFINHRLLLQRTKQLTADRLDSLSCRSMDPTTSYYSPRPLREVEFSCSSTPSYTFKVHARISRKPRTTTFLDPEAIAKAFEVLDSRVVGNKVDCNYNYNFGVSVSATPSPVWRSPKVVRQLRVTDSPFPVTEEERGGGGRQVDGEADEFIRRFYEQLRLQHV